MPFCRTRLYIFLFVMSKENVWKPVNYTLLRKPLGVENSNWYFQSETLLSAHCSKKDICVSERIYAFELDYTEGEKN